MLQFELHGHGFRADKLNAREQFHLSRKLAPLLPPLAPLFEKVVNEGGADALKASVFEFLGSAGAFADALATMKDADADAIFNLTLGSVQVKTSDSPEVWMPLWVAGGNKPIVADLNEFSKLLPVVVRVVQYNLGNFIDGFLTRPEEPAVAVSSGARSPTKRTGSDSR